MLLAELGLSKETLRVWGRKHKGSGKSTPAQSVDSEAENRRWRSELVEAKRANEMADSTGQRKELCELLR